jgi:hypothetical protein
VDLKRPHRRSSTASTRDKAGLTALTCGDADPVVPKLIDRVDRVKSAKLNGSPTTVSSTEY